ncbi:phospholipase B [Dendrothele bispora CBS 962.96]|uniref:Lysophospholipase n=1 Tax=Dendrothele bispora (strain CBS 962.96) TaxID=1314807 RepID=A0A4V4HIP0_DENBC|nr:phospholipase B [Dendrothele bispora CBS 962.96]
MFLLSLPLLLVCAFVRAFEDSVTDYAPSVNVECPDITNTQFVREFTASNQSLNPQEAEYVATRLNTTIADAWKDWLGSGDQLGYNVSSFQGVFPKIGLALPGGGLRAAQWGASSLSALDARNESSKAAGTGGLLQVSSYLTGLSGGSWITGSIFFNNFPGFNDLVFGNGNDLGGWLLDLPFATPDGTDIFSEKNQYFFGSLLWSVMAKAGTGIDTSITDPWARMISYRFLNQTSRDNIFTNDTAHGAGQLWSNIPDIPAFQQHLLPIPILVTDSRPSTSNDTRVLGLDSTVYEITPFELASFDPSLSAGANISYAGTHLVEGRPANGTACVTGFDQAGFMMGTSASLFNQILDFGRNTIQGFSDSDANGLLYVLSRQLSEVRTRSDDVANWPNPFQGLKKDSYQDADATWLSLIDGASNIENIPLGPLFVRERGLDVVVTLDGSADTSQNWPNGTGVIFSSQRQQQFLSASHQPFPPFPQDAQAFLDTGVTLRPTFMGCDPHNNPPEYPLMIYIPNTPPFNGDDPVANTATFRLTYTQKHMRLFFDQVHNNTLSGFVPNTNNADPNFGVCLQCASVDRARYKVSNPPLARSDVCQKCFDQYCFDPQNPPSKDALPGRKFDFVDPDPQGVDRLTGFLGSNGKKLIGGLVGLVVLIGVLIGVLIWWRKRKEKNRQGVYKRVSALHQEGDEWRNSSGFSKGFGHGPSESGFENRESRYEDYVRPEAYELPSHQGSLVR